MIYGMLNNKGTIGSLKCQSSPALRLYNWRKKWPVLPNQDECEMSKSAKSSLPSRDRLRYFSDLIIRIGNTLQ